MKGRTKWFPRDVRPVRPGVYECAVRWTSRMPLALWMLEWDGVGFLVPIPMEVHQWRGLTKTAYKADRASGEASNG